MRVTLVVRDGSVHVSLAGEQATTALLQGAPELRRLLEQAGAVEARVVVRDAPAPAPDGHPGPRDDGTAARHDGGGPGGHDHDRRPGTAGGADDGAARAPGATDPAGTPRRAAPVPPIPHPTTGRLDRLV
ncbi:hypothetical protein MF408_00930 [Nocardioides sp. TF02-7]|nr:hypothetical protein MF408_00930 [Nocardioides sp. TF02-7]